MNKSEEITRRDIMARLHASLSAQDDLTDKEFEQTRQELAERWDSMTDEEIGAEVLQNWVTTARIHEDMQTDRKFADTVTASIMQFLSGDWGTVSAPDWEENDISLRSGDGRILAAYSSAHGKFYISMRITGHAAKNVTILYADEY